MKSEARDAERKRQDSCTRERDIAVIFMAVHLCARARKRYANAARDHAGADGKDERAEKQRDREHTFEGVGEQPDAEGDVDEARHLRYAMPRCIACASRRRA